MRPLAVALAAVALIVGLRASMTEDDGYPFVLVEQGLTSIHIEGERIWVMREGSSITGAWSQRSPGGGGPVRWCPREEVFWDGETIWDARGRHIFGTAPRDLDRVTFTLAGDGHVYFEPDRLQRSKGRGKGRLAEETLEFYRRYLDQEAGPFPGGVGGRVLVWCPNPQR